MTQDFIDNRQIRIFISSTFRDMQEERDYLITKVFPSLRRYCGERDVSIHELDLRWGISEEEAKQGKVFEICLKEVINTKPFFIGLLGERYGWIPTMEERKAMAENTSVFEDFPWVPEKLIEGTSITEIEIQEGVLRSKEKMNAYFYFRSPEMETPREFREKSGSHEEQKLSKLKNILREQDVYPFEKYDSIEHLGTLVEKDFKALVDDLFPQASLSPLEKERLQQRGFFKSKTGVYVSYSTWNAALDKFIESEGSAVVITGESGMGKSAFLANWIKSRQEKQAENKKIIYHFIGASQSEGDYRKIIQRLINEIQDIYNISIENINDESADVKKPEDVFQKVLFALPKNEKLIIILDGIDRLFDIGTVKLLNWLPSIPENVKIIFSVTPDDKSMEAFTRRGYAQINIGTLPLENRKQIVIDYLKLFSKSLASDQVERIVTDKKTENPLVLLTVLDELRVFGVHEKLNERIGHYLASPDNEGVFEKVLQRIEDDFNDTKTKNNFVKDIISLITVSRQGLSETEILDLSGAAPLYWSQLSNGIAGHLTTMNGLVSFSNNMIRNAAKKRYTSDSEIEKSYRGRIASFMETNENVSFNRKCDELPYQLYELNDWDKLYSFLCDIRIFNYIYKKDMYEMGNYWRALYKADAERYTILKYNESDSAVLDNYDKAFFFSSVYRLHYFILNNLKLSEIFLLKSIEFSKAAYGENHIYTATAYNNAGNFYNLSGDYMKALENHNIAIKIKETMLGKEHSDMAILYNSAAACYLSLGEYQKALEYYNHALEIREKVYGLENVVTSETYDSIGTYFLRIKEFKKALEYYNKALEIREKILGRENNDTAVSINNIGICYSEMGDYKKALEYYHITLPIMEKLYGKEHLTTAFLYNNIGSSYSSLGEYQKTIEYYNKALFIREQILGKNHPETANSYNNLGVCSSLTGDFKKALEYHNKALVIRENVFGKKHLNTANSYNNLGHCLFSLNEHEKALNYYNEALEITENILGGENSDIALYNSNIGAVYCSLNNYQKALEYFFKSISIWVKTLGKNHKKTASLFYNTAVCYDKLGDKEKALEHYFESASIYEQIPGQDNNLIYLYNNIITIYNSVNDYNNAVKWRLKIIPLYETIYGFYHQYTANIYFFTGLCYSRLNDVSNSLEYYIKALDIRRKVLGNEHSDTLLVINNIGTGYYKNGNYQKALEYHLEALEIKQKIYKEKNADLAFANNKAAMDYEALNDKEKSIEYYNMALSIYSSIDGNEADAESVRKSIEKLEKQQ